MKSLLNFPRKINYKYSNSILSRCIEEPKNFAKEVATRPPCFSVHFLFLCCIAHILCTLIELLLEVRLELSGRHAFLQVRRHSLDDVSRVRELVIQCQGHRENDRERRHGMRRIRRLQEDDIVSVGSGDSICSAQYSGGLYGTPFGLVCSQPSSTPILDMRCSYAGIPTRILRARWKAGMDDTEAPKDRKRVSSGDAYDPAEILKDGVFASNCPKIRAAIRKAHGLPEPKKRRSLELTDPTVTGDEPLRVSFLQKSMDEHAKYEKVIAC